MKLTQRNERNLGITKVPFKRHAWCGFYGISYQILDSYWINFLISLQWIKIT